MRPLDDLPGLVEGDGRLVHRGRWVTVRFLLGVGDEGYLVEVVEGRVASVARGPFVMPDWRFALRAPADGWARFWAAAPPAGSHDLLALLKGGSLRVEGDLHPFMANLQWFKDVVATLREAP